MKTFSSGKPPPGRTVRVGRRDICVAEIGNGPPLLMLHGGGPGAAGVANFERNVPVLAEHFRLTGDRAWLRAHAPRLKANAEWIVRQRQHLARQLPGGQRLWSKGLQPAHVVTPDSERMHMQFYESEAYYWLGVKRMAEMQGGQIFVESTFGSGSRFTILLPWVVDATQPMQYARRVTDRLQRVLTNNGTVTWTAGQIQVANGTINNNASFTAQPDKAAQREGVDGVFRALVQVLDRAGKGLRRLFRADDLRRGIDLYRRGKKERACHRVSCCKILHCFKEHAGDADIHGVAEE